jgi:excisionase family DNA binding protein
MASRAASDRASQLLSPADVAAKLNVSIKTVRRLIAANHLAAHRIGGQLRITPDDLMAFVNRGRTGVSV